MHIRQIAHIGIGAPYIVGPPYNTVLIAWHPRQQSSWGHIWAPCCPHEPCYQGWYAAFMMTEAGHNRSESGMTNAVYGVFILIIMKAQTLLWHQLILLYNNLEINAVLRCANISAVGNTNEGADISYCSKPNPFISFEGYPSEGYDIKGADTLVRYCLPCYFITRYSNPRH